MTSHDNRGVPAFLAPEMSQHAFGTVLSIAPIEPEMMKLGRTQLRTDVTHIPPQSGRKLLQNIVTRINQTQRIGFPLRCQPMRDFEEKLDPGGTAANQRNGQVCVKLGQSPYEL
jgi:hypothetical protein